MRSGHFKPPNPESGIGCRYMFLEQCKVVPSLSVEAKECEVEGLVTCCLSLASPSLASLSCLSRPHAICLPDHMSTFWWYALVIKCPLLLKSTEVPLLLRDVPLSVFVSVGSALYSFGSLAGCFTSMVPRHKLNKASSSSRLRKIMKHLERF